MKKFDKIFHDAETHALASKDDDAVVTDLINAIYGSTKGSERIFCLARYAMCDPKGSLLERRLVEAIRENLSDIPGYRHYPIMKILADTLKNEKECLLKQLVEEDLAKHQPHRSPQGKQPVRTPTRRRHP